MQFIKKHYQSLCIALLGIGFFLLVINVVNIEDYDYFFHYATGEYIAQTGEIPKVAIGSWYGLEKNLNWISHEWLFGYVVYWITNITSEQFVCVLAYIGLLGLLIISLYTQRNRFKNNIFMAIIMTLLLVANLEIGFTPRPHVLGYYFTVFLYLILNRDNEKEGNTIFWLIPLTILWVNFHGGSYILVFIMAIMSAVWNTFKFDLTNKKVEVTWNKQNMKRWVVILLCFLSVGLNGHGLEMYTYPFTNIGDTIMQEYIVEWHAPDLKDSGYLAFYVMFLFTMLAFISTKKERRLFDICFWLGLVYLVFRSMRFIPQFCLISYLIFFRYSDNLFNIKLDEKVEKLLLVSLSSMMVVCGLLLSVPTFTDVNAFTIDREKHPSDELIEIIKEEKPERLYNEYGAGGYLMTQHIDTFIDGRADIYSKHNLLDYMIVNRFSNGALETLDKYDFDYFLTEDTPLKQYLETQEEKYELIGQDENFYLYKTI